LAPQLRDLLRETHPGETGGEPGAERLRLTPLVPNRVAEDLAGLLFRATPMPTGAAAKLLHHVLIELPYQELTHVAVISRYRTAWEGTEARQRSGNLGSSGETPGTSRHGSGD